MSRTRALAAGVVMVLFSVLGIVSFFCAVYVIAYVAHLGWNAA